MFSTPTIKEVCKGKTKISSLLDQNHVLDAHPFKKLAGQTPISSLLDQNHVFGTHPAIEEVRNERVTKCSG
jgi:hypothetical protein